MSDIHPSLEVNVAGIRIEKPCHDGVGNFWLRQRVRGLH